MHEGHRKRLRDNFVNDNYSVEKWQLHNVLELLLFYCVPRIDTNELAHKLLNEFGSIAGVLDAPVERLRRIEGVGESTVAFLKLLPQVFNLYVSSRNETTDKNVCLHTFKQRIDYFIPKFFGKFNESFWVVCLDNKENVICGCEMFSGSVNITPVNKRKIVEYAIVNNSASIIVSHNHPDGLAFPSTSDCSLTKQLAEMLEPLGITLIDHIIIANNEAVSMAQTRSLV